MNKLVLLISGLSIAALSFAQSADEKAGAMISNGLRGQTLDGTRLLCDGYRLYKPIIYNPEHAQSQQQQLIVYIPIANLNAPEFSYSHSPGLTGWQAAGLITLGLAKAIAFPYSTEYNLDK